MSAVIKDLEKHIRSAVFPDILLLLRVFVEMQRGCRIFGRLGSLVSDIGDLISKKFAASSNLFMSATEIKEDIRSTADIIRQAKLALQVRVTDGPAHHLVQPSESDPSLQ